MASSRQSLYRQIEQTRKRPLIAYVTSTRQGSHGQISGDAVAEIQEQLQAIPRSAKALDLLLVSSGGDPTVAWRIVSLIRERVQSFSVLIPQAAYSAATLIVLGADEIVMHPNGNLGPTDPQITAPRPGANGQERQVFGSEDLAAFVRYAKETVSIKDEALLTQVFLKFVEDVGSVAIGVAARSSQLGLSMAEKLLQLHMKEDGDVKKAKTIAQRLGKEFFHHGYPLNRTEAKEIGLKVTEPAPAIEQLMWKVWSSLNEDLALRSPFHPMGLVKANAACAPLFSPVPVANIAANMPPEVMQQLIQSLVAQCAVVGVPGTPFENSHALVESVRVASRFVTKGTIFASRQADLTFKVSTVIEQQGWETTHRAK